MNRRVLFFVTTNLIRRLTGLAVMLLITSCGSNRTADTRTDAAPATGSVAFTVEWEPPQSSPNASAANGFSLQPMDPVIGVCRDYGIKTMKMQVLSGLTPLRETGDVNCNDNTATLYDVPAGNNYTLNLIGTTLAGGPDWNGFSAPFTLTAGETKNVGKITMSKYNGSDHTPPTISSVSPLGNATNVPDNSTIQVAFSEPMAVNTVIDNSSFVVLDNASNRVSGTFVPSLPPTATSNYFFQPTNPLASGGKYTVTIDNTFVTDMARNSLAAPYTWGFTVHERGGWWNPTIIDAGLSGSGNPSLAMNSSGVATVVWEETVDMVIPHVYANRYTTSTGAWGTAVLIETSNNQKAVSPKVSMDESGKAIAVWQLKGDSVSNIYNSQYRGGTWGVPDKVDTSSNQYNIANPTVFIHDVTMVGTNGSAFVIWAVSNTFDSNIFYRNWRGELGIWEGGPYAQSNTNVYANLPTLILSGSGSNFASIWIKAYSYDVGGQNVCCKGDLSVLVGKDGHPINGTSIDNDAMNSKPAIAVDNNNSFIVVWPKNGRIYARRGTGFSISSPISLGIATPISDVAGSNPSIAMNNNGDAVAVWAQNTIYANRYTAGAWGTAVPIGSGAGNGTLPKVAMNASGDAVAVWIQNDGTADSIYANRFSASAGTWGNAVPIESGTGSASSPQVAMDSNGRAVAVWVQNDGTRNRIYSNRTD